MNATRIGGQEAFEQAYTRQGAFTDESFVQAGQRLKELVDLDPFQTGFLGAAYPEQQALMGNGEAAMELMGHWAPAVNASVAQDPESRDSVFDFVYLDSKRIALYLSSVLTVR